MSNNELVEHLTVDQVWERAEALAQRVLGCSAEQAYRRLDAGALAGMDVEVDLKLYRHLMGEHSPVGLEQECVCAACLRDYSLGEGCEPSKYCNACVHDVVAELEERVEALDRIIRRTLACGQLEKLEDAKAYLK